MDHFYRDLPGWASFTDLYKTAVANAKDGDRFVEVGSWLGRSAAFMGVEISNSGKAIFFHCVDPWEDGGPDLRNTSYFKDLKEPVFDIFTRNVSRVSGWIIPMRMTSVKAASTFPDKSVDFIMLDGDHNLGAVDADIAAWLPKMKPGSVMSGDDYLWPGVKQATEKHFGVGGVKTFIVRQNKNYKNSASYWWKQL